MIFLISSGKLMMYLVPIVLQESGPVNEIEMIRLSSWEWFLLLSIVILIIWLLILYQRNLSSAHGFGTQSNDDQEYVSESLSMDNNLEGNGIDSE